MPALQSAIFSLIILLGTFTGSSYGQVTFIAEPESNIWIEGKSNINEFGCEATSFEGSGLLETGKTNGQQSELGKSDLNVEASIPIEGFECGKRRMNRDLYNALKGDDHPHITFEFIEATATENPTEYIFQVDGELTVAGVTRRILFEVIGSQHTDKLWRVIGQTDISMKDFGIDPPSPMFGMVRVDDRLVVNFDLVVEFNNETLRADFHE